MTGIAASAVLVYGFWLYIQDTLRGNIKPHFWTWAVFFTGSTGGAISAWQGGAGMSGELGLTVLAILCGVVWGLSWKNKYRHKGLERKYHPYAAGLAVVVYVLQLSLHFSPDIAAIAAIAVDFTALNIQRQKCLKDPKSEEIKPWLIGTIGGLLVLVSLTEYTFASLAFPIYFLFTNAMLVAILRWHHPPVRTHVEMGKG